MRIATLLVGAQLLSAQTSAAQKEAPRTATGTTTVQQTLAVPAAGFIRIFLLTGSIRVQGWDRDSLSLNGTVSVPADGEFQVLPGKQGARVSVWGPDETRAPPSQLVIRVPRRSQLWIKSQTADVEVTDFEGSLDVVTIAGQVRISGRPREVYLESMGGSATLDIASRSARIKTGSGPVTVQGDIDDLTVSSVSGAVTARNIQLRQARFESVDGAIRFSGDLSEPAALEFISHSGDIELALAPSSLADVRVNTVSGAFRDDWGISARSGAIGKAGKLSGKEFGFLLGDEALAEVSIRNFKGAIILKRLGPRAP
jgi:hypothetical protein